MSSADDDPAASFLQKLQAKADAEDLRRGTTQTPAPTFGTLPKPLIKKSYEISKWMSGSAIRRGEAGNGSIRVSASGSNSPYFREQTYMRLIHLKPAEFFDTINGLAEEKFVPIADG